MTERHMGTTFDWFLAKVIDRKNDDTQSGKLKIRIYGYHDDETNLPDTDLPWAYPVLPITSSSHGHVGTSPTFVTEGATVVGFWMDKDKQIPVVFGTIYKSNTSKDATSGATGGQIKA